MYSLSCPSCQQPVDVSPSQAGDQLPCPSCGATVQVPKLGDLRQLPHAEQENAVISESPGGERSAGSRIGFVVLSLISVSSLVIAVFCGIRWALLETPMTTKSHLEYLAGEYEKLDAARLIREFEDMEEIGLAGTVPYKYKQEYNVKYAWGRNAAVAGGLCAICGMTALILVASTRPTGADT